MTLLGGVIMSNSILMSCGKDEEEKIDESEIFRGVSDVSKEEVIQNYNENYLGSDLNSSGWKGSIDICDEGLLPEDTYDKAIQRINYFRGLVGLNTNVTMDMENAYKYQKAALIMEANMKLSHLPPEDWHCWSQDGYDGAASSNLGLGTPARPSCTDIITNMIHDHGVYNASVGHRRWILHSTKTKFSLGATNIATSLGVFNLNNSEGNTQIPEFIAYPAMGYMPQDLIYDRWSFGIPDLDLNDGLFVDFSEAKVTMRDPDGHEIQVNIEYRYSVTNEGLGAGDPSIVWHIIYDNENPNHRMFDEDNPGPEVKYSVTISDVKNAAFKEYKYDVIIFKP